jgi:hypothetical protein
LDSERERLLAWFRAGFSLGAVLVSNIDLERAPRFPLFYQICLGRFRSLQLLHLVVALWIGSFRNKKAGIMDNLP